MLHVGFVRIVCKMSQRKRKNLDNYWTLVNDTHTKVFQPTLKCIKSKMNPWLDRGIKIQTHRRKSKQSKMWIIESRFS